MLTSPLITRHCVHAIKVQKTGWYRLPGSLPRVQRPHAVPYTTREQCRTKQNNTASVAHQYHQYTHHTPIKCNDSLIGHYFWTVIGVILSHRGHAHCNRHQALRPPHPRATMSSTMLLIIACMVSLALTQSYDHNFCRNNGLLMLRFWPVKALRLFYSIIY